jgi:hypothetical protein
MSITPLQRAVVYLETDTHGEELRRADDARYVVTPGYYVVAWPLEILSGPYGDPETATDWANEPHDGEEHGG